jgi:hypothetical protein
MNTQRRCLYVLTFVLFAVMLGYGIAIPILPSDIESMGTGWVFIWGSAQLFAAVIWRFLFFSTVSTAQQREIASSIGSDLSSSLQLRQVATHAPNGPRMHAMSPPLQGCKAPERALLPQKTTDRRNLPTGDLRVLPHRVDLVAGFWPTASPGAELRSQLFRQEKRQPRQEPTGPGSYPPCNGLCICLVPLPRAVRIGRIQVEVRHPFQPASSYCLLSLGVSSRALMIRIKSPRSV